MSLFGERVFFLFDQQDFFVFNELMNYGIQFRWVVKLNNQKPDEF